MGSRVLIDRTKTTLLENIASEQKRYFTLNALRNPYKDLELYSLPIAIAFVSWILSYIVDSVCDHDICERAEDTLENIYLYVLFGGVILMWRQISGAAKYLKENFVGPLITQALQPKTLTI